MGCDIHAVWQAKKYDEYWKVPDGDWEQSRHYFLFAWLADVRNGYGVAGVPTHDLVTPISKPRGFPEDWKGGNEYYGQWMGDHSFSWLMADEILAAPRPEVGKMRTGIIPMEAFSKWDRQSQPDEWCGGITGPGIIVAASPRVIVPGTTHVTVEWPMPPDELDYFVDEVRRMRAVHGATLRLVFGFDS